MLEQGDSQERTALVSYTRTYPVHQVLSELMRLGFTTSERPCDNPTHLLPRSRMPTLMVLAVDPACPDDREIIRSARSATQNYIVALCPGGGSDTCANALIAGADVCIRDGDCHSYFGAQVDALLRRVEQPSNPGESASLTVGDLVIDFARRQVRLSGHRVDLAPMEFRILEQLAERPGTVLSPAQILLGATGTHYPTKEAAGTLKVYVSRLRQKLGQDIHSPQYIRTSRGFGYMLERRIS